MNDRILDFLIKAKKSTYAGYGPEGVPSRPGSHDLHFSEGDLQYIDTYLGGRKFAGEEAVWVHGRPVWCMNYAGRVVAEGFSGDFLKEALREVSRDCPFRGPQTYTNGRNRYQCSHKGDFNWFYGYEEIFHNGTKVYECAFHGGLIE